MVGNLQEIAHHLDVTEPRTCGTGVHLRSVEAVQYRLAPDRVE